MELLVVGVLTLAGLVVVLLALRSDTLVDPPAPRAPDWSPLPSPAEITQVDFPLRVPGYDPASVDVALATLAEAYADLLAEADAETVQRARRRAAQRLGVAEERSDGLDTVLEPTAAEALDEADAFLPAATPEERNLDALRTEVVLDLLRRSGGRG